MLRDFKVFVLIMFALTIFLVRTSVGLAEIPLGMPKANTDGAELVPIQLINRIALKKAQEKWGQVSPGPSLPCCDEDGNIVAYMCAFSIGTPSFPTYSEILSSVKNGRKIAEQGLGAMAKIEQRKLMDDTRNKAKGRFFWHDAGGVPNSESEGPQHQLNLANNLAKKLGRERMIGAGKYGTVVVSARYDRFPVPVYMHFLPPYFYNGDLAMYKASTALSTESVILERIYFLEGGHNQYFEFSSSGGKILIHSYNLEIIPRERTLRRTEKEVIRDTIVMSQIAEEWIKIEKEVE